MAAALGVSETASNRERILVAHRDGGVCPLCPVSLVAGDALWPLTCIPRQRFAHRACAAQQAGCAPADLVPPPCKHWQKRGACQFGADCFFAHIISNDGSSEGSSGKGTASISSSAHETAGLDSATASTVAQGKATKGKEGRYAQRKRKPVANDSRAFAFRAFLIDTFGLELLASGSGVLDVGGGHGEVAFQLVNLNHVPATVVDPRPLRLRRFARKAAFGMYTRNFALSRYNHPSLPAGCELDPGALKAPAHMRVLFQALGSASGRAPIPATSVDDGVQLVDSDTEKGRVQCSRLVAALSSASTYAEAVAHAKGTAWTRKGLVHEGENADESAADVEEEDATEGGVPKPTTEELRETSCASGDDSSESADPPAKPKHAVVYSGEESGGNSFAPPCEEELLSTVPLPAAPAEPVQSAWQHREALLEKLPALQPDLSFEDAASALAQASLVVGLHPDQAAAEIVAFSAAYAVPFAIVPCCVYRAQFPARKLPNGQPVRTYDDLVAWCVANGPPGTESAELPFEGKNKVVFWRG